MGLTDLDLSPLSHSGTAALLATVNGWSQGWWLRVVALRVPVNLLIQLLTAANNAGSQAPRISVLAKCHCDGLVSCECVCGCSQWVSEHKACPRFRRPRCPPSDGSRISKVPPPLLHSFVCLSVTLQPRPTPKLWNWGLVSYCAWEVGQHLTIISFSPLTGISMFRPFQDSFHSKRDEQ